MKNAYPNIKINVFFEILYQKNQNKIQLVFPVHTLIKKVQIELAKKLSFNPFKFQCIFMSEKSSLPMNECSSLYQNDIQNNNLIFVKIINIQTRQQAPNINKLDTPDYKNATLLDLVSQRPYYMQTVTKGLNLNAICTNKRCINFNKNTIFCLGLGTFDYQNIIKNTECPNCPDKMLFRSTKCIVKDFVFQECLWSLEGIKQGNLISFEFKQEDWIQVNSCDLVNFKKVLLENNWGSVKIIVKNIGKNQQKLPYYAQ
ncbi:hypothetical protein IMG5_103310 [Ichthyophthirius multifiliis]|uniref:Ubiquitin-like domain-containing protein n=1 Tax=Ichthyophthirius multifiliis TaxID=5932 RepID=G0QSS2_ICHMU|nr:hypothetical protein IMG5_103310 [Ichthyophthirius multifiliis]EGR31730.1 hypothetical protein IMG5_103310 [Ichthyophthirius multifiliis]|eukprot:XP_004035216.1 hypothetical protein IMG5_103310 [Ichthyophthirius multifiliis]